jgi:hypothetical protein
MNIIETPAPISIENLKNYFVDDTTYFNIDYKNSTIKSSKILIYLSNLDVPCDIVYSDIDDEFLELLKEYFHSKSLVKLSNLEIAALEVILGVRGFINEDFQNGILNLKQINSFYNDNKEIVDSWLKVLDSLPLFNMKTIQSPEIQEFVDTFPLDDTEDLTGLNFVNLLKYPEFFMYYGNMNMDNVTNYRTYFTEYIFKGKNLYSFWANENNPMFLITLGIADGNLTGNEIPDAIQKEKEFFEREEQK